MSSGKANRRVFPVPGGVVEWISIEEAVQTPVWQEAFAGERHDHRYFEMIGGALAGQFDLRCLLVRDDSGEVRAVQPAFVVAQDLLAAAPRWLRALCPSFRLKTVMAGNPAGESSANWAGEPWVVAALHEGLRGVAGEVGASIVVLKDFPAKHRAGLAPFVESGFARIPSMPAVRLPLDYASFDDYMARRLSHATRKDLRRKFREEIPLVMEMRTDISPLLDEIYPLYEQVHARSILRFERLTPEYLSELGRQMPDKVRFFVWRLEGRLVAFSVCLVSGDALHDEYLGMDYDVALRHSLYFRTFRDLVTWAIAHGLREYRSTPLGYEPKLRLGFELVPLDLYVRHTSRWINPVFRRIVRWLGPVRGEPVLRRFSNAAEL